MGWSRRHPVAEDRDPPPRAEYLTVEVERDDLPPLRELEEHDGARLVFSRVRREGQVRTPEPDLRLQPGDLVTVIGPSEKLAGFADVVGREADEDLPLDRHQVDFRRVVRLDEHIHSQFTRE
jgi:putative transport protein